ncbi:hypothetical protein ILUMI_24791 [Ignelater luminosus]|uniref:Uncharacterized protein n=1 Tax=Ignelater luminosus TaxID=2038154 RepID=A0A8K0CBU0_IGNLU|nr:hypothetical protein ILUMI_24791 [Ignelater luminosus]
MRERPSLHQKSIIDYVIRKQQSKLKFRDCRVKSGANCGSDHYLVWAKLVVPFEVRLNSPASNYHVLSSRGAEIEKKDRKRYRLDLLHQESIMFSYQRKLETALENLPESEDILQGHNNVKLAIK